jgi:integrase
MPTSSDPRQIKHFRAFREPGVGQIAVFNPAMRSRMAALGRSDFSPRKDHIPMSNEQLILPLAPPAISPAPVPTFAEAKARITTWTDLPETRRRDMASAITTAAKIIGRDERLIPCDVAWLNRHLFEQAPAEVGKSKARIANLVSLLRAVLRRLALHAPEIRGDADLPPEWRALLAVVPEDARRSCLRGFARFCVAAGIAPPAVTDTVLAEFAAQSVATRLAASVKDCAATTAAAWNGSVRAALPGWPGTLLTARRRRQPYTLPIEAYPKSLQDDVEAYRRHLSGTDAAGQRCGRFVIRGTGPAKPLKPTSVKTRLFAIQQAAGILVLLGEAKVEELRSLRDLVQPVERVGAVLDWLAERHAAKHGLADDAPVTGGQVAQVAETLRQVAAHHVGLTGGDLAEIQGWAAAVGVRRQMGMSDKMKTRLRKLIQPIPRALLLHLPDRLMAEARAATSPQEAGRLALWATALEILLFCPLRQRSLRELRLDRNLQRLDPRTGALTRLVLHPDNMKAANSLDWPVPPRSAALIEAFIRNFRPAIAAPDNPYLLPGEDGTGARSQNGLSAALVKVIAEYVGVRTNLHLLRHLAAWRYLKQHPGRYEDVRRLLGHRDVKTTMTFYVEFETEAAAVRFDGIILREKTASRAIAAAAWGRLPKPRMRKPPQVAP